MNVTTMRRLDRWLGIPTCFLLTAWRHFIDTVRRKRSEDSLSIQRILIVKLAEQGATVLAYPALRRAVEMAGRENVFFLVFKENRFILDCLDVIPRENVVSVSSRGVVRTMASLMSSLRRVRRIGVDAVIDLEFFARSSAVLCYLSGAVVRVGLHRQDDSAPYRGDLMTHRIRYNPDLHTMQMFLLMAEAVGTSVRELRALEEDPPVADGTCPAFVASEEERAEVRRKVEEEAGTAGFSPLILLNANASDLIPLRRWPTENYVELARRLLGAYPSLYVAFTGAPDEREKLAMVMAAIDSDRCLCMAGKTTLRQLLVLYGLADVLVTNDSGPAHFAVLTPIKTVTLFGPETPALFGAVTPRSHVIWKDMACSPCVSAYNNRVSVCRDNRCMKEITVDEVYNKVREFLEPQTAAEFSE